MNVFRRWLLKRRINRYWQKKQHSVIELDAIPVVINELGGVVFGIDNHTTVFSKNDVDLTYAFRHASSMLITVRGMLENIEAFKNDKNIVEELMQQINAAIEAGTNYSSLSLTASLEEYTDEMEIYLVNYRVIGGPVPKDANFNYL